MTHRPSRPAAMLIAARRLGMLAGLMAASATAWADAPADEPPEVRTSASLDTWLYGSQTELYADSLLNPGNRLLRVPANQANAEARLSLRATLDSLDAVIDTRAWAQRDWLGPHSDASVPERTQNHSQINLTQGFARIKHEADTFVAGRELLTWGPGTFRSPSNPFYFDAGRTQPLAATPGIDLLRFTRGIGPWRATLGNVFATSEITPAIRMPHTRFLKVDHQGDSHLISLNVALRDHEPGFVGAFAQLTPDDAWLLYGEVGMSSRPAPSGHTWLGGASYTLENGHTFTAEWLHNNGGLRPKQMAAIIDQAEASVQLARQFSSLGDAWLDELMRPLLAQTPRLLGRNYVWLGWQSNPQDTQLIWRTELTTNITDGSAMAMFYIEKNLVPKVSAFAVINQMGGSRRTEFGAAVQSRLTLGLKFFVF